MADVVIISGYPEIHISTKPCGAHTLASYFRDMGMSAMVVDHIYNMPDATQDQILDKLVNEDTKVICFSMTLVFKDYKPLLDKCKQRSPNAVSIVGGSVVTGGKRFGDFDFGVIGQGEGTIPAILAHKFYSTSLQIEEEYKGTKYITDKVYPFNEYNNTTSLKFTEHDLVSNNETLIIEFGRGCVFKCGYCYFELLGKEFGDLTKTEEIMYSTLMHNYEKFGTTRYIVSDDTINDSLEKALVLQKIVRKLPFKFEFGGYMRLELFKKHPEMAEIYYECGLIGAKFGIETFNRKSGLTVGKGFGEEAKPVLERLHNVWQGDVNIGCNFLIGLPYDTIEDLENQCRWLEDSPFIGNVAMNALQIRKNNPGDLIEKKILKGYYKELPYGAGVTIINWESPIMNRDYCNVIANEYFQRVMSKRTNAFDFFDGFTIPVLMQEYTKEELKNTKVKLGNGDIRRLSEDFYAKRLKTYTENILQMPAIGNTVSDNWKIPRTDVRNVITMRK